MHMKMYSWFLNRSCADATMKASLTILGDREAVKNIFYVNVIFISIVFGTDCIGSAFNVKGIMQCPNCRKIEKGQWLYADGSRSYAEINIDDLVNPEDVYDLTYHESSMWCPYSEFSRLAAAVAIE
ncbi:putative E3 ubiquitin-protein ligase RFI2 [Helianthus annuus]|nr:putative E3 ubiquitin-protein ligase RFI2 [Helianthus annuus]